LEGLRSLVCRCEACPLGEGRIKFVFGEGPPGARLMFVGEGPGRDEDIQGRPFVGRAGALLDRMIAALGLSRGEVYIANIVKCRPPDNRVPTPEEARACMRYLERQVGIIKPGAIVGLGATPLRDLVGGAEKITKVRGSWHSVRMAGGEIPFMPTFHPAYVLRNPTPEIKRAVWEDLKAAKKLADQSDPAAPAAAPADA
jgi:DNA polymerase